jgi:hypothetical protein
MLEPIRRDKLLLQLGLEQEEQIRGQMLLLLATMPELQINQLIVLS